MSTYPSFTYSMYLRLKELILSLDLIFTGKEFHNKIDDVKNVLPPSVFLLYLGQRSVMCP